MAALDDRVEHHYLEVKGPLDLRSKKDQAKLAKFILGAANRMPDIAATAFEGFGVMVIGVSDGAIIGMPPVEVLDIDKAVRPFIGADGPRWDLLRVPVSGGTNEVLLLLVDPPRPGQGPFICRKDGEGLRDGAVYVRVNGETREARSDELALLIARGRSSGQPDAKFEVRLIGDAVPILIDDDTTLEAYISAHRSRLLAALPKPKPSPQQRGSRTVSSTLAEAFAATESVQLIKNAAQGSLLSLAALNSEPESRTEDEYRAEIEQWEQNFREAWPKAVERLAGILLPVVTAQVTNQVDTFFQDVELVIHLEGDVIGVEADAEGIEPSLHTLGLPSPPRAWGPRERDFSITTLAYPSGLGLDYQPPTPRSMSWENTGSVTMRFDVGDLRPRETYQCEDSNVVVVVAGPLRGPIRGTWQITARDHHRVYEGEVSVPIASAVDLTQDFKQVLGLTNSDEDSE